VGLRLQASGFARARIRDVREKLIKDPLHVAHGNFSSNILDMLIGL